jgi:hypothetical protein
MLNQNHLEPNLNLQPLALSMKESKIRFVFIAAERPKEILREL